MAEPSRGNAEGPAWSSSCPRLKGGQDPSPVRRGAQCLLRVERKAQSIRVDWSHHRLRSRTWRPRRKGGQVDEERKKLTIPALREAKTAGRKIVMASIPDDPSVVWAESFGGIRSVQAEVHQTLREHFAGRGRRADPVRRRSAKWTISRRRAQRLDEGGRSGEARRKP